MSTLQAEVYNTLKSQLLSGRWKVGQKLAELKIAAELGVNRNPVREALLALSSEGLVERQPGLGCRVARLDRDELINLYQLREVVEGMAARLAATAIEPIQLMQLEQYNRILRRRAEGAMVDTDKTGEIDNQFHRQLLEFSGNSVLLRVWDDNRLRALTAKNLLLGKRAQVPKRDPYIAILAHERILDALRAGDPDSAEAHARAHVAAALQTLLAIVPPD